MTKDKLCSDCKKEHRSHRSKFCSKCISKKREENREFIKREVLGIRKRSDLVKEWAEKRKLYMSNIPNKDAYRPYLSISKVERQILWKKYCQEGLSYDEADWKVKSTMAYLKNLMVDLKAEIKSEEDLGIKFREEFAKLLR